jgi:tripartite motif-containing protein 71
VFVADLKNHRMQVFDATGRFLRGWGEQGSQPGQFLAPAGVAFDADDNVYVSEIGNHRVQVFTREGLLLTSFGGPGAAEGQLQNVHGLIVAHGTGRVYVADSGNNRVQVFAPLDPSAWRAASKTR